MLRASRCPIGSLPLRQVGKPPTRHASEPHLPRSSCATSRNRGADGDSPLLPRASTAAVAGSSKGPPFTARARSVSSRPRSRRTATRFATTRRRLRPSQPSLGGPSARVHALGESEPSVTPTERRQSSISTVPCCHRCARPSIARAGSKQGDDILGWLRAPRSRSRGGAAWRARNRRSRGGRGHCARQYPERRAPTAERRARHQPPRSARPLRSRRAPRVTRRRRAAV